MNIRMKNLWPVCAVAGVLAVSQPMAQAQNAVVPATGGRFMVELKDATLADALEMVFKAAGNPSHIIDESAKDVSIASASFNNAAWDAIVRQLANENGFLVRKNQAGTTVVEPRTPAPTAGAEGGPMPGRPNTGRPTPGRPTPGRPTPGIPANPFGASLDMGQTPTMIAEAQFGNNNRNNNTGNNTGNNNNNTGNNNNGQRVKLNPDGEYRLLVIRHVYAGGIARIFSDGEVIPTEQMVLPESAGSGIGNSGNSGGGVGGGIGGGNNNNNSGGGGGGGIFGGLGGGSGGNNNSGGGGGGGIFSDRNLKENVAAVDSRAVLEQVAGLPIQTWNYKDQDTKIRHIGPMAQDFAGAFGVGEDNRRINYVDANGVTLASIQALYQITLQQSEQIKALQQELTKLRAEKDAVAPAASQPRVH